MIIYAGTVGRDCKLNTRRQWEQVSRRARKQVALQVKDKVGAGEQQERREAGGQWTRWTGDWQCGQLWNGDTRAQ